MTPCVAEAVAGGAGSADVLPRSSSGRGGDGHPLAGVQRVDARNQVAGLGRPDGARVARARRPRGAPGGDQRRRGRHVHLDVLDRHRPGGAHRVQANRPPRTTPSNVYVTT